MTHLYVVPDWFLGYSILLEVVFVIITILVSLYSFKIYKLSHQRQSQLFGIGFLSISLSYIVLSFLNFAIFSKLNDDICTCLRISNIDVLHNFWMYIHMILFLIGLITLAYMALKVKSSKTYSLLFIIVIISLLFSPDKLSFFNLIASILLIYIVIHYIMVYVTNKKFRTLLVLISFIFLLFGRIHFLFSVDHGLYYVIAHFLILIAYSLILVNLILILKNEQKKG